MTLIMNVSSKQKDSTKTTAQKDATKTTKQKDLKVASAQYDSSQEATVEGT